MVQQRIKFWFPIFFARRKIEKCVSVCVFVLEAFATDTLLGAACVFGIVWI